MKDASEFDPIDLMFLVDVGDEDDDYTDDDVDMIEAAYDKQVEPPWSPVPVSVARQFIRANPDANLDVVFPTVYEEDRSAKLKDLALAEELAVITHQRMSEQSAKELGFEQYDYQEEQDQRRKEPPRTPPGMLGPQGPASGGPLGAGDGLARSILTRTPPPRRAELSGDRKHDFRRQQRSLHSEDEEDV